MSRIIARDNLEGYQRWSFPDINSATQARPAYTDREVKQEPVHPLPTLEQIEAIQREAHEEGHATGYEAGYKKGCGQGYQDSRQQGYEEGYQQGRQEGFEAGHDEIKAQVEYIDQILSLLAAPLNNLDCGVEEELVQLAIMIAKQLLRRELKTAPDVIIAVVKKAVGLLPINNQQVRLTLHPEDAQLVRDMLDLGHTERRWHLLEDPTLTRGGCRVDTDTSRIDATVESRLGAVIATVLGDEREHNDT